MQCEETDELRIGKSVKKIRRQQRLESSSQGPEIAKFVGPLIRITEPLPADAGRFMPLKILKYHIVRDFAAGGATVFTCPEVEN